MLMMSAPLSTAYRTAPSTADDGMPPLGETLAFTAITFAPGATPTTPTPLTPAATMPATWVPWSYEADAASKFGSASFMPKSHPAQSSTKVLPSSSTPLSQVSSTFTQRWPARSGCEVEMPVSITATTTPAPVAVPQAGTTFASAPATPARPALWLGSPVFDNAHCWP